MPDGIKYEFMQEMTTADMVDLPLYFQTPVIT
ncbi:Uncharacterised protein [Klebsiella pneumoniae]|nr:Uncharacterised protein [Klebsiella pneumoniae]